MDVSSESETETETTSSSETECSSSETGDDGKNIQLFCMHKKALLNTLCDLKCRTWHTSSSKLFMCILHFACNMFM